MIVPINSLCIKNLSFPAKKLYSGYEPEGFCGVLLWSGI